MDLGQKNPSFTSVLADRQAWSDDQFARLCEMYQTGALTLEEFCYIVKAGK
jgi:hypothetical protein